MAAASITALIAILAAFTLVGYNIASSQAAAQLALLQDIPLNARISVFTKFYMTNLKVFLPLSASSLTLFTFSASEAPVTDRKEASALCASATALMLANGLVTKLVQLPGVERLLEIKETGAAWAGAEKCVEVEMKELIRG